MRMTKQRFQPATIQSPLPGVSIDAWGRFSNALEVQASSAVSSSGGLGAYDIRPRRLIELGYAKELRYVKNSKGRWIHECEFILPWTKTRFLTDALAQFVAFSKSISLYHQALMSGDLKKPQDASMASALAVLHIGGRGALEAWPKLFDHTREMQERVKDLF